jgi:hypothetical protein
LFVWIENAWSVFGQLHERSTPWTTHPRQTTPNNQLNYCLPPVRSGVCLAQAPERTEFSALSTSAEFTASDR